MHDGGYRRDTAVEEIDVTYGLVRGLAHVLDCNRPGTKVGTEPLKLCARERGEELVLRPRIGRGLPHDRNALGHDRLQTLRRPR